MSLSASSPIAASPADVFEVPVGYRADVLIAWGDEFADHRGNRHEYGFNNDFIAYFPLKVYISFTNNSSVKDVHGAVRRLVEDGNDPEAATFTSQDFANGGPTGRPAAGEQGFSCCDNLVFDDEGDLWVVTDISSGTLNDPGPLQYHANNAAFFVPTSGPNAGIAYRFANMPVESEGTGPYFTPDEKGSAAVFGQPETYPSYWPASSKTNGGAPALPRPATVVITKPKRFEAGDNLIPRPAG